LFYWIDGVACGLNRGWPGRGTAWLRYARLRAGWRAAWLRPHGQRL